MTTTTDNNGEYLFDMIPEGDYIVHIPSSEFVYGEPLGSFISSPNHGGDDNMDDDVNENGIDNDDPKMGGVSSETISLTSGSEPTGETGQGSYPGTLPDDSVDMTVDFGFFELLTLGNYVWFDTNNDGQIDPSESPVPAGVTLNLLDSSGNPILHPITGQPMTTTTDSNGYYLFTHLYPDDYIVEIDPSNFQPGGLLESYISSTGSVDPDDDSDVDDNGVDEADPATNGIRTMPVTLNYDTEPDNNADTDDNDNTNLTVDLGLILAPTAVSLTSFTVTNLGSQQVQLAWTTALEMNNFGYYIYRSSSNEFGSATQITFVSSTVEGGTGPGAAYSFTDDVPAFGSWYYWLVDVETDGDTAVHTPVSINATRFFTTFLPMVVEP
jgi:hypothetical protein